MRRDKWRMAVSLAAPRLKSAFDQAHYHGMAQAQLHEWIAYALQGTERIPRPGVEWLVGFRTALEYAMYDRQFYGRTSPDGTIWADWPASHRNGLIAPSSMIGTRDMHPLYGSDKTVPPGWSQWPDGRWWYATATRGLVRYA